MRYCSVAQGGEAADLELGAREMAERLVPLSVRPARRYASEIVTGADHLGTQA